MKSGGQILWNSVVICENDQDLLADRTTPYERRFGEALKAPITSFGAMVEYHPSSPKDQMSSSIWQESTTWNLSRK